MHSTIHTSATRAAGAHPPAEGGGEAEAEAFTAAVRARLGDPRLWTRHDRYHGSLALCIIEAVRTGSAPYGDTVRVVDRYRAFRRAQGCADVADGARDLLRTFEQTGCALAWAGKIGSFRMPYHDGDAVRAAAIQDAAAALHGCGIDTVAELRAVTADPDRYRTVRDAWLAAAQSPDETSWTRLLMLAGVDWVHPDGLTVRFADDVLGTVRGPGAAARAAELVDAAAAAAGTTPVELQHAIWRWQLSLPEPAALTSDLPAHLAAA